MSVLVLWRAEDAESGAQRIAGRPAQAFWRRLRPSFRGVLLEPHRRAGDGRVTWSWNGPTEPALPAGADLASLRKRLGAGLLNLSAELERDAEEGGGEAAALREGMQSLINGLTQAADAELAGFAVRTETGWMIRSWGIARPSPSRRADEVEDAPPAEPEPVPSVVMPAPPPVVPAASAAAGPARPRVAAWLAGGLLVSGLVALAIWGLRSKAPPDPVAGAGPEAGEVFPMPSPSLLPAGGEEPAPPGGSEPFLPALAGRVLPGVLAVQPVATRPGASSEGEARPGKVVPVPMAYTGPITSPSEEEPKPRELAANSGSGANAEPARNSAGKGGQTPADSPDRGHAGLVDADSERAVSEVSPQNVLESRSADRPVPPGEARDRAGEQVRRDGPRAPAPGGMGASSSAGLPVPFYSAEDALAGASRTPERPPLPAVRAKTQAGERDGADLAQPPPEAPAPPAPSSRSWSCSLGEWRLARTLDVALSTVPSVAAAGGEPREALAAARRRAWEQVRATLPHALHQPVTRAGWVLLFRKVASQGEAPVWRIEKGGGRGVLALAGADRAELGWAEPVPAGLVARLLGPDGAEWASLQLAEGGRTLALRTGPQLAEAAPWFEVRGHGADAAEIVPTGWSWRSLRPGWLDTRWQQDHRREATRVFCFAADPLAALPVEGVVALEHPPSGWALAREVGLTPGQ